MLENLTFASTLGISVVGIIVVFIGLILLMSFIQALAYASRIEKKTDKKEKVADKVKPVVVEKPIVEQGLTPEIIAAITAAVSCMLEPETKFVVRRVKRASQLNSWQKLGIEEQMYHQI